jgi:hypothetical protein
MATDSALVVIGALITAIDAAIPLDGLVYTHDANAVATCALHHIYCRTHCLSPAFTVPEVMMLTSVRSAAPTISREAASRIKFGRAALA